MLKVCSMLFAAALLSSVAAALLDENLADVLDTVRKELGLKFEAEADKLRLETRGHRSRITQLEEELRKQQKEFQNSLLLNQQQRSARGSLVGAFSAYLVTSASVYHENRTILFPSAVYNTGAFSTSTGIFTAPQSGVYSFSLNLIACHENIYFSARIRTSGSGEIGYIGVGYDSTSTLTNGSRPTGSGTFLVSLEASEQLVVEAAYSEAGIGFPFCLSGLPQVGFNWFTGFLVGTAEADE
eukprot:GHVU01042895.1.p1 GENE.GHVU01042895.1~~GHVU01042895.1.p1  ORF type:complete len:241 (-),score=17.56 GHVU01042895.1:324-1046(-)